MARALSVPVDVLEGRTPIGEVKGVTLGKHFSYPEGGDGVGQVSPGLMGKRAPHGELRPAIRGDVAVEIDPGWKHLEPLASPESDEDRF